MPAFAVVLRPLARAPGVAEEEGVDAAAVDADMGGVIEVEAPDEVLKAAIGELEAAGEEPEGGENEKLGDTTLGDAESVVSMTNARLASSSFPTPVCSVASPSMST